MCPATASIATLNDSELPQVEKERVRRADRLGHQRSALDRYPCEAAVTRPAVASTSERNASAPIAARVRAADLTMPRRREAVPVGGVIAGGRVQHRGQQIGPSPVPTAKRAAYPLGCPFSRAARTVGVSGVRPRHLA